MKAPKNCSRFQILVFIFQSLSIFIPDSLQAQSIPPNPNKMENGKRQGRWTLLLNEKKSRVDSLQYATYYRLITYQDGKPTGITQDYYLSGKLQMQGKLISEGLVPKYEGIVTYYRPNGKKDYEEKYENGKSLSEVFLTSMETLQWKTGKNCMR